jgi:hypothetical protein
MCPDNRALRASSIRRRAPRLETVPTVASTFVKRRRYFIDQAAHARQTAREASDQLDRENNETFYAYAHFLGESPEYVLNQLIDTVLARDKEFVQWRATHQHSFVAGSRGHAWRNGSDRRGPHHVTQRRERQHPSRLHADRSRSVLRILVDARALVALTLAAATGLWGLQTFPVPREDVFLGLIAERAPHVYRLLAYGYATLWFLTPYFAASLLMSLVAIAVYRRAPSARARPLPPYPSPEVRSTLMLVLGETHFHTLPGCAPSPEWLTIPQRGLYTGIMILGAVGTGKTSACMYPYVAAAPVECRRRAAPGRRLDPGGEGGLLRPGAIHPSPERARGGLRRDRAGQRRLLQPVAQRAGSLRRRPTRWPRC